jgi:hypothetical protein
MAKALNYTQLTKTDYLKQKAIPGTDPLAKPTNQPEQAANLTQTSPIMPPENTPSTI